jgi:hypothetical protein
MRLITPKFKKPYIELENEQEKELFKLDKDKEIERLKEEYMILQNASDEVEEEKDKEIERQKEIIRQLDIKNLELTTIIKEVRECINRYAIENEDYSKIYNDEEKELLEILDKENNNEKSNNIFRQ